jgi:hypothetical protein
MPSAFCQEEQTHYDLSALFSEAYEPKPNPGRRETCHFYPTSFRTKGKIFTQSTRPRATPSTPSAAIIPPSLLSTVDL